MQSLFDLEDSNISLPSHPFTLRGLKSTFGRDRTNDDVHSSISLCSVTREVLDTPQMQRLRGLKQLGTSEMTYITTTHTRFEHSLGVASLAENMVTKIKTHQPQLGVSAKDILCVKLAGLFHDLGHGPFSHVFDAEFRNLLKQAQEQGQWLGHTFNTSLYQEFPPVMDGWAHEDASLMMIDALLEHLGLQIDEEHLDAPLKQIGSGIKAEYFGICEPLDEDGTFFDGKTKLPPHRVLTSRDWIFIKECVLGGPLPKRGLSIKASEELLAKSITASHNCDWQDDWENKDHTNVRNMQDYVIGRPEPHKEWLYTVVANRYSGFDVDKLDYYARDSRRAFSNAGGIVDPMFLETAVVAWGSCERPDQCLRCLFYQQKQHRRDSINGKPSAPGSDAERQTKVCIGKHLMICFPEKMVFNAMDFFRERFKNHQKLYTHGNSKAVEYMICDVLLLSDPWFRICSSHDGDGCEFHSSTSYSKKGPHSTVRLPISRAMTDPQAYLKLKDSVIDLIANTEDIELLPARQLINRIRSRKLYKRIGKVEIHCTDGKNQINHEWQRRLWDMPCVDIATQIIKCGHLRGSKHDLRPDDIIIEKRQIHHGMKGENPVNSMRFLQKSQMIGLRETLEKLPEASIVHEEDYWCVIPRAFLQKTVRIYCRSFGKEDFVTTCYYQFLEKIKKDYPRSRSEKNDAERDSSDSMPVVLSQTQSPFYVPTEAHKRPNNGKVGGVEDFKSKIRKLYLDEMDSP